MNRISAETRQALEAQKKRSIEETRQKLEQALNRIILKSPNIVAVGTKINAANLAREAGVDRATLYRFHQPVLERLRLHEKAPTPVSNARNSNEKEYRRLVEEAQRQVEALARFNYKLQAKVDELQALLSVRDRIIREFKTADVQYPSTGSVLNFALPTSDAGKFTR